MGTSFSIPLVEPWSRVEYETDFALNVLRQQDLSKSIVFSPLSTTMSLGCLTRCTKGKTEDEIFYALFGIEIVRYLCDFFGKYAKLIRDYEPLYDWCPSMFVNMRSVSRFFIRKNSLFNFKYNHDLLWRCVEEVEIDFADKEKTAELINEKMFDMTKEQIDNIVSPDSIADDTDTILANAIYFRGCWAEGFDMKETKEGIFLSSPESSRLVHFLSRQLLTNYVEDEVFQEVRIPFHDQSFSLDVFLPKETFGLSEAVEHMTRRTMEKLFEKQRLKFVNIKLPKFKLETTLDLKDSLIGLGMKRVFNSRKAEFESNRSFREKFERLRRLKSIKGMKVISQMPHKAVLEIDEGGANHESGCHGWPADSSDMEDAIEFDADHPFLFMVVKDGHPILMGVHN